MKKRMHIFSPSRTILFSMLVTIVLGTLLLALPWARTQEVSLIDLLFTATSCTCVTGLMTVPMEAFSTFGICVIMGLLQIGGLGLMTLSLFVVSLFVNLGMATQVVAGEMLDLESWKDTRRIILFIIGMTVTAELIGTTCIFFAIKDNYPLPTAMFYAIFHAISGFCNGGITLFPNNMVPFAGNTIMLMTIAALMFIGGFGFISWKELFVRFQTTLAHRKAQLSLQTRVVLRYYGMLTAINTILLWILEQSNTLASMNFVNQWCNAFFMAVSCRSGGYSTLYLQELQNASLFVIMINAFIGAAPGSTGSGIKLTTFAIVIAAIQAVISSRSTVNIKGRQIMTDQIYRALSIVTLSLLWTTSVIFILLITERQHSFLHIVFETISAFSTLGASIGVTAALSAPGKLLIALTMLVGRIGVITLLLALRKRTEHAGYSYPEERVMIT